MDSTDSADKSLAVAIAIATRSSHTRLNKSIIARLPLVVNAPDPSAYVTGLLHIAPIYLTFETLWQRILDTAHGEEPWLMVTSDSGDAQSTTGEAGLSPTTATNPDTSIPHVPERIRNMLQKLHLPELMRSNRLRADIQAMTGWSGNLIDEQLQTTAQAGALGDFTSHIQRSIEQRPHVLIAYSYILFMALFAGGRYMRATFESAGDEFWQRTPSKIKSAGPKSEIESLDSDAQPAAGYQFPLGFFHFATPADGEDLRRQFKEYLLEAEQDLSHSEKDEIVQEAVCIFDHMELLVAQLDQICGTFDGNDLQSQPDDTASFFKSGTGASRKQMKGSPPTATGMKNLGPGHPSVSINAETIKLCPAMNPTRRDRDLATSKRAPSMAVKPTNGSQSELSFSWVLMAALGAVVVGAIMTTRREMMIV